MKYPYMVNFEGKYYPAGTDVPVGDFIVVSLTDNVPDGALNTNADGSVNAYDAEGNVVGTVDAETVAELQAQAGETLMNQNNQDDNLNGSEDDLEKQDNADDAEGSTDKSQQNQDETDDKKDDVSTDSEKQEDDGTPAQEQDKSTRGRKSKEE